MINVGARLAFPGGRRLEQFVFSGKRNGSNFCVVASSDENRFPLFLKML
jgi:hypothetical protein